MNKADGFGLPSPKPTTSRAGTTGAAASGDRASGNQSLWSNFTNAIERIFSSPRHPSESQAEQRREESPTTVRTANFAKPSEYLKTRDDLSQRPRSWATSDERNILADTGRPISASRCVHLSSSTTRLHTTRNMVGTQERRSSKTDPTISSRARKVDKLRKIQELAVELDRLAEDVHRGVEPVDLQPLAISGTWPQAEEERMAKLEQKLAEIQMQVANLVSMSSVSEASVAAQSRPAQTQRQHVPAAISVDFQRPVSASTAATATTHIGVDSRPPSFDVSSPTPGTVQNLSSPTASSSAHIDGQNRQPTANSTLTSFRRNSPRSINNDQPTSRSTFSARRDSLLPSRPLASTLGVRSPTGKQRVSKPMSSPVTVHNLPGAVRVLPPSSLVRDAYRKQSAKMIPDEKHLGTMQEIVEQIPKVKLRRTEMILGPDGQMKPNPFWAEIYDPRRRFRSKRLHEPDTSDKEPPSSHVKRRRQDDE